MRFSGLVDRIGGEGAEAWAIHFAATQAARRGEDVIMLTIGDPDFSTPDHIIAKAVEALEAGDTHYTDIDGTPAFRAAVARYFQKTSGVPTGPENVCAFAGTQNALFSTAMCIAGAGDEIIVIEPMYVTYEATIGATGARMVLVPAPAENGFRVDVAALGRAITPRTRAIFFATPNNPTGAMATRDDLQAIADLAVQHDLWVVSDEVYAEIIYAGEHVSIAALPGMAERTVTVSSLSKSHAMPGWRAGWAIGPVELMAHFQNLSMAMLYGLPGFVQQAAVQALEAGAGDVTRMRAVYRARRDLVHAALKDVPGLTCFVPQGGMFMLVNPTGTGLTARDYAWRLFEETGVAVLDATPFGPSAKGFLRVSFTLDEATLGEACQRIGTFTERLMAERRLSVA